MAEDLPELQPYEIEPINTIQEEYHESSFATEDSGERDKRLPLFIAAGVLGVIGLLALLSLLFTGGGSSAPAPTPGIGDGSDGEEVTLFWWGVFLDKDSVQPLLDKYNQENPNVTIQYTNIIDGIAPGEDFDSAALAYQNELNRVLDNESSTDNPDIFMVNNSWVGDYESLAQPSSTYSFDDISNNFYPAVQKDFANQGVVYGVPLWMDTLGVIYNNDLLSADGISEPSDDWFLFKEQAETLTKRNNNSITQAGFAAGSYENVSFNFNLANLLLFQNGVLVTNENNQPTFANDPDSVDAMSFLDSFSDGSATTWSSSFKNASATFIEGGVAMIVAPSWRLREILRINDEGGFNRDIRVSRVPQIEGQDQDIINFADYWGNMVSIGRPYSSEAWEFLRWITQPEQLRELSNEVESTNGYFGILYPRSDMQTELVDSTYLKVYNESLPFAETWYMIKGREVKQAFINRLSDGADEAKLVTLTNDIRELQALKGILTLNAAE